MLAIGDEGNYLIRSHTKTQRHKDHVKNVQEVPQDDTGKRRKRKGKN